MTEFRRRMGERKPDDLKRATQVQELVNMLPSLDTRSQVVIKLRFWECMTIQEIASTLSMTWDEANQLIENTLEYLRERFNALENQKQLLAAS